MKILNYKFLPVLLLILFFLLGFFLRIYKVGEIPGSLSPDEAALGYNAYSLLKTGADEHGVFAPLALQSFGDWKLSGYSFFAMLPIALFGLNEFSVRLPSVIVGSLGIIAIYFIAMDLFRKQIIALFSSFLFTISLWSIYFSRAAYEVNIATTVFLFGLLLFLRFIYAKEKKSILFLFSALLFGVTFFVYHSYAIFMPIFFTSLLLFFRKQIQWDKKILGICFIFVILFFSFTYITYQGGSNKISTLLIFNDENVLYNRVEKLRGDHSHTNKSLNKVIHTKYVGVPYQILQNYIAVFNPVFLFDKGGEKLQHNLGSMGNFYLIDAVLLFIGFIALVWNREKSLGLLLLWLFIAPLPSIITKDTPNTTRLFTLMPLFILIIAYGIYVIFNYFNNYRRFKFVILGVVFFLYITNFFYFIDAYFIHFNTQRVRFWHYGYKQAVLLAQKYPKHNVVMTGPKNFPYIYFLFYTKYDPVKFRKEVVYYPKTSEGFYYVKSFDHYQFIDIINYSNTEKNTLYIDQTRLDDKNRVITLPSGEPIFGYLVINGK